MGPKSPEPAAQTYQLRAIHDRHFSTVSLFFLFPHFIPISHSVVRRNSMPSLRDRKDEIAHRRTNRSCVDRFTPRE